MCVCRYAHYLHILVIQVPGGLLGCQTRLVLVALILEELGGLPDYLLEALGGQMTKCSSIVTAGTAKSQASSLSADWLEPIEELNEAEAEMWMSSEDSFFFDINYIARSKQGACLCTVLQCLKKLQSSPHPPVKLGAMDRSNWVFLFWAIFSWLRGLILLQSIYLHRMCIALSEC